MRWITITPLTIGRAAKAAAFYFWLFPQPDVNFYPWGCRSIRGYSAQRARVSFISYVWNESLHEKSVGGDLHKA